VKFSPFPRVAQLFGVAVLDQIVLSAANFLMGFLLIRRTSDSDYALFVLVQSALTLVLSVQWAWLIAPLTVAAQQKSEERRREMVGAANGSQSRVLARTVPVLMVIPGAMYAFEARSPLVCSIVAIGILAGWSALRRDYVRSVLMMYRRSNAMFSADLCYVAVLAVGTCFAVYASTSPATWTVITLAVAGWCGAAVAFGQFSKAPGWVTADAAPVWREIRSIGIWSVIGAIIYWLFTQSYNYVLATRFDLSAVADVNSSRLLLMPVNVLTVGVISMLMPTAASWLAEVGLNKLLRRLLVFLVAIALLDAMYFACVWVFRDWLTLDLLRKAIADRDRLLLLWAAVVLIGLIRDVLQCALFALARQKSLAWLIGISAVAALSTMWWGLGRWGPSAALIGQVAGEGVNVVGLIALLYRRVALDKSARGR
jgi:O-antigen/teichoic acid export membrane protein